MQDEIHFDFETRSTVPFGKAKGAVTAYQYARHPSTDVWCMSYAINNEEVLLWDPWNEEDFPSEVLYALKQGMRATAHNAGFEYSIWNGLLVPRLGLPKLPFEQMDCTAARAAVMSLPRSLEGAGAALGLDVQKDTAGARLMMQMAKPRKPRKDEDPDGIYWWDDEDRRKRLGEYCITDTVVERDLGRILRPLSADEREVWLLDHKTNMQGVQVDVEFARKAQDVMAVIAQGYADRISDLTQGAVSSPTEVGRIKSWVIEQGVEVTSLDKTAIIHLLEDETVSDEVKAVLQLRQEAGKSSVAKLARFDELTSDDGRMRENFMYHGANTGRLAGRGAQLQNLPSRGGLSWKEAEKVIELVTTVDDPAWAADLIEIWHGSVPTAMSSCLRGTIQAPAGKSLFVADYSNIEGRVAAWLGGEAWKLQAFRDYDTIIGVDAKGEELRAGPDLYKVTAGQILGITPEEVNGTQRNVIGKVPELALGFGGGVGAFRSMAQIYNVNMADYWDIIQAAIEERFISKAHDNWGTFGSKSGVPQTEWLASEAVKLGWRARHQGIVRCWADAEQSAIKALQNPRKWFEFAGGKCAFGAQEYNGIMFLITRLPNGRRVYRAAAGLKPVMKFGRQANEIRFKTVDGITRQWVTASTYGGDLFQTCLAKGTLVLTFYGWKPIEDITTADCLWDGQEWITSDGAVNNGVRETLTLSGIRLTPDHGVLTDDGWKEASQSAGYNRAQSRLPNSGAIRGFGWQEIPLASEMCMRHGEDVPGIRSNQGREERVPNVLRVQAQRNDIQTANEARYVAPQSLRSVGLDDISVLPGEERIVPELRGAGGHGVRPLEGQLCELLAGHEGRLPRGFDDRTGGYGRALLEIELPVGDMDGASEEQTLQSGPQGGLHSRDGETNGDQPEHTILSSGARLELRRYGDASRLETVYDVINAGPRNRFVVKTADGHPLIVHNCVQAIARDIMVAGWSNVEKDGFDVVLSVHDEVGAEAPDNRELDDFIACMVDTPAWADGCPVSAAGYKSKRYRKD